MNMLTGDDSISEQIRLCANGTRVLFSSLFFRFHTPHKMMHLFALQRYKNITTFLSNYYLFSTNEIRFRFLHFNSRFSS